MEKLQFHKIHLPPLAALLFLHQFLSVSYSLTDNYFFINCGTATHANPNANTDRYFVGDLNSSDSISSSFSFTGHSSPVTNSNQSSGTSSTLQVHKVENCVAGRLRCNFPAQEAIPVIKFGLICASQVPSIKKN